MSGRGVIDLSPGPRLPPARCPTGQRGTDHVRVARSTLAEVNEGRGCPRPRPRFGLRWRDGDLTPDARADSRAAMRIIETEADIRAGVKALRRKCATMRHVHDTAGDPPLRRRQAGFEGL